jgi:hypothetical protein
MSFFSMQRLELKSYLPGVVYGLCNKNFFEVKEIAGYRRKMLCIILINSDF